MGAANQMPTRRLGISGLQVGAIGMGCMPLSIQGRPEESEAIRTIHTALEQGVTLFDTADSYCLDDRDIGHNEKLLAKALDGVSHAIIATKGGTVRPEGRWVRNGHPEHLKAACEASLKALDREEIMLYQLHAPDPDVPYAESVGALARLQEQGKIVHIGLSNVSVRQLEEALSIVTVVSVQNRMHLFDRSSMDVLRRCEELGIAFLPYSPLAGMGQAGKLGEHERIRQIADRHQVSPQRVALAWLLQLSPVMLPIPGASRGSTITDSAAAASLTLTADEMAELNAMNA